MKNLRKIVFGMYGMIKQLLIAKTFFNNIIPIL